MKFKVAPLSGGFMLLSLMGILFSVLFLHNYSLDWSFTVGFVSTLMFIASVISMTYADVEEELILDKALRHQSKQVYILSKEEYDALPKHDESGDVILDGVQQKKSTKHKNASISKTNSQKKSSVSDSTSISKHKNTPVQSRLQKTSKKNSIGKKRT